ncbi:MAG: hypothetical protein OER95_15140, partial [Acidimicrobiia bacterium]|nr:hypothetical protein [Acidimicrobiia bacterium]
LPSCRSALVSPGRPVAVLDPDPGALPAPTGDGGPGGGGVVAAVMSITSLDRSGPPRRSSPDTGLSSVLGGTAVGLQMPGQDVDGQLCSESLWRRSSVLVEVQRRTVGMTDHRSRSPVEELGRLESALTGLRAGVVEMEQSPSYLMLVDASPSSVTAARFATVVSQAADLWLLLDVLTDRLSEARAFADTWKLSTTSDDRRRLAELDALLAAPVRIPASAVGDQAPDQRSRSGERGSLSPNHRSMPPQAALDMLRQRYDALHTGVARIDHLWLTVLPRIEAARETAVRLEAEARELGVVEPLVGRVRDRADELAERLMSDPIGIEDGEGIELDRLVAEAARQMASLRTGFENLDADLEQTEESLANLRVLRSRAEATAGEARTRVVGPHEFAAVPAAAIIDGPGGMADQLDKVFALARQADRSRWTQQRAVLDVWLDQAERLERQLMDAEDRNRRPLERRDELRGRLQAFQAKMAATGHAESPAAMALADDAWTELYTAPTDLAKAEAAIADLADELRKS